MARQKMVQGVIMPTGRRPGNSRARVINTGSQKRSTPVNHSRLDGLLTSKNPKICVYRRLGGIGDVVMTTPMLKHIKRLMPKCHLVYATDLRYANGALHDVLRGNPFIDEIISFQNASAKDFDFFTDVTATGLDREKPNTTPPNRIDMFAAQAGIDISSDPLPTYVVSEDEKEWARKKVEEFALPRKRSEVSIIGVQLRSNDNRRTWPEKNVKALLEMLTKDKNVRVVLFAWSDKEKWNMPQVYVMGESLRYTSAIIDQCDVMVTPDSSLLHIAGALQKKTIAIFGPIPPESRINHYQNTTAIIAGMPCAFCWYRPTCGRNQTCMSSIEPEAVYRAIKNKEAEEEKVRKVFSINTGKGSGFRPDNVVLVKRHHGGYGDIMMTLPGIEKLRERYPSKKIYYALPKQFHCIAENSPYIDKVIDVDRPTQNNRYSIVTDISIPCAQYESSRVNSGKKVELNRVEIFAEALGTRHLLDDIKPKYYVTEEEKQWAQDFLPETDKQRIAIVLRPADVYREWPIEKFKQLLSIITDDFQCVIIDQVRNFEAPGAIDGCGFPYRKAAALVSECDMVFTPNSSFLALSAALDIPTVTTFGPLDPDAVCKMHSNATVVKSSCPHMPCWRNSEIPCKIKKTAKGYSSCMESLSVKTVYESILKTAESIKK